METGAAASLGLTAPNPLRLPAHNFPCESFRVHSQGPRDHDQIADVEVSPAVLGVRHGVTCPTDAVGELLLSNVQVAAHRGNDQCRHMVPPRPLTSFRCPRFVPLRLQSTPQSTAAGAFLQPCAWITANCVISYRFVYIHTHI
jgi:hypothetical protein